MKPEPVSQPTPTSSAGQEKPEHFEPFRLSCLIFDGDELVFSPKCSRCKEPILDFAEANLELAINPDYDLVPLGEFDGTRYSELCGTLYAFHLSCSPPKLLGLWKRLNTVLRSHQPYVVEEDSGRMRSRREPMPTQIEPRSNTGHSSALNMADLPPEVRELVTASGGRLMFGDCVEASPDGSYRVLREGQIQLVVYRCPTCGRWIDVLGQEHAAECNECRGWREHRRQHPLHGPLPKERPICRRAIVERALSPWPAVDAWDGRSAKNTEGQRSGLSDGMRRQLRRMIMEGYFNKSQGSGALKPEVGQ